MSFAALPLAVALAALPVPQAAAAPSSSTYDQATCAALRGEMLGDMDGWDRAAIGENAPVTPDVAGLDADACPEFALQVARYTACADRALFGDKLDTCYLPRITGKHAALRPLRAEDARHAHVLLGQVNDESSTPPMPQPERREPFWALAQDTHALSAPLATSQALLASLPRRLQSVSYRPTVPPPRG